MPGRKKHVWLNSAAEIAEAIGRSPRAIPKLVAKENLPAFKFYNSWTATMEDLTAWSNDVARRRRPGRYK